MFESIASVSVSGAPLQLYTDSELLELDGCALELDGWALELLDGCGAELLELLELLELDGGPAEIDEMDEESAQRSTQIPLPWQLSVRCGVSTKVISPIFNSHDGCRNAS